MLSRLKTDAGNPFYQSKKGKRGPVSGKTNILITWRRTINDKRSRYFERTVLLVIAFFFVVWSAEFIFRTSFIGIDGKRYYSLFDDAMISMRYGWNLSHGLGLVWNPGEHVEGFTNLLMTLVMSVATMVFSKAGAVLSIQVMGVGLMLGSAYMTFRIARISTPDKDHEHRSLLGILCFLSVLFYFPLAFWSLMGMETGLLTMLLLLGLFYALKYVEEQTLSSLLFTAIWLGLAFLTRNDSAIFTVLVFVYILYETYKSGRLSATAGRMLAAAGLYGLFIAGLLVFRKVYYGELLPNTYVLKLTGLPLSFRIRDGMGFVSPFLTGVVVVLAVIALYLILDFQRIKLFLGSFIILGIVYQVWVGGDPWPYWRIMAPAMPLVFLLFIQGLIFIVNSISNIEGLERFTSRKHFNKWLLQAVVIILAIGGLVITNLSFLGELTFRSKTYTVEKNEKNVNAAIAVDQLTTNDATVGVFWGGSVPYYTGRQAMDFLGKADRYIAHLPPDVSGVVAWSGMISVPGHNKYDLDYSIKTLKPTYIQGSVWGLQDLSEWAKVNYEEVDYCGQTVLLLKNSDMVYWNRVGDCPQ